MFAGYHQLASGGSSCDWCSNVAVDCERCKSSGYVLTNKLDCLVKPGTDIGLVVVLDGDTLVKEGVLKMVGAVG